MKPPVRDAWEAFLIYFFPTLENWNDFIIFAQKPKIMDNKAIPDNVFRYNLGKDVTKIETPLKVYNMATQQAKVVNAVWDTGATCSAVSRRIVKELELTEDGVSAKIGIAGTCFGTTTICFAFPGNGRYSALVDADILDDFTGTPDFVVGLDIITLGDFRLSLEGGSVVMSFVADTSLFMDMMHGDPAETQSKLAKQWERVKRIRGYVK